MHLVLNLRENMKKLAVDLQCHVDGWEAVKQFVGAMAVVFCKASNGYIEVQLVLNHLAYNLHLPLATISDNEVG